MARKRQVRTGEPPVPEAARPAYEVIVGLTDAFCRENLDGEYQAMCRRLAGAWPEAALAPAQREAEDLGLRDHPHHRLGQLPRRQQPAVHMKLTAIDKAFGVAESTGQGKSKAIRTMLKIRSFDPQWTLPSRMGENRTFTPESMAPSWIFGN